VRKSSVVPEATTVSSAEDNGNTDDTTDRVDEIIPEFKPDRFEYELSGPELELYEEWRYDLAEWALRTGKNIEYEEGYSEGSVRNRMYRIDKFCAWVWSEFGWRIEFTHDHADAYWYKVLRPNDNSRQTNIKDTTAIKTIYKKQAVYETNFHYEVDESKTWDIPNSKDVFKSANQEAQSGFTDWFDFEEMQATRNASLRVWAINSRDKMSAEDIDSTAAHIAQSLRKPKSDLTDEDWERATSYKQPSLVHATSDVGFRPSEVKVAHWGWIDFDRKAVVIPKDESRKNSDNWKCSLSEESVYLLKKWKAQSETMEMYDDTDLIWLTRKGNPYSPSGLRRSIMHPIMDEAGIDKDERESGFYMFRRGLGTDIGTQTGDVERVKEQLRITNNATAARYMRHDDRTIKGYFNDRWV
jgi:integrase